MSDEKKKIVSLRISPKTIEEVREKAGEQSIEYQFIKTLKDSNVPYSILSNILDILQTIYVTALRIDVSTKMSHNVNVFA